MSRKKGENISSAVPLTAPFGLVFRPTNRRVLLRLQQRGDQRNPTHPETL